MNSCGNENLTFDGPGRYRIRIKGFLGEDRSGWLGGMQITTENVSARATVTTLEGELSDQAALSGILNAIYDMHLPLVLGEHIESDG